MAEDIAPLPRKTPRELFSFMVCDCYVWPVIRIESFSRCGACHSEYVIIKDKEEAFEYFKQQNNNTMPKPKGDGALGWWELKYWQD